MPFYKQRYFSITVLLAIAIFILFAIPNSRASENPQMVQVFEPDESSPLPYTLQMITPAPTIDKSLRQFIFYEYYYYGFPHFGYSAAILLPLQWTGQIQNTSLVMLSLRQGTSVLLMLLAIMLLVYLQDKFRTYRSVALFVFLVSVPAVVQNNFWWHPDGMVTLLAALTLFFLERDQLHLRRNFLLAAVTCAIATAAKNIGAYFFLAVALVLLLSFIQKKSSLKKTILMALIFLGVMAVTYVLSNPFLLSQWGRTAFQNIFNKQTDLLLQGYGITYGKGLLAAWPLLHEFYGESIFLMVALISTLAGVVAGTKRLLHALILAWFIPVSVMVIFVTHFKFQYGLPVALPLFSCLVIILPENFSGWFRLTRGKILQILALTIIIVQSALFISSDITRFSERSNRAENEPSLQFYDLALNALQPLQEKSIFLYSDARLYIPSTPNWKTETTFELLEYTYIQQNQFDVLLLMEQRLRDYLQPGAVGIDPTSFARSQQFYRDADQGNLTGYKLIFRNSFGLIFVRDQYQNLFKPH